MARRIDVIIQKHGVKLSKNRGRLVIEADHERKELPFREIKSLAIATKGVRISSDLLKALAIRDIPLLMLDAKARPQAILTDPSRHTELVLAQVRAHDAPALRCKLAAAFVRGKIRNQIHHLNFLLRQEENKCLKEVSALVEKLDSIACELSLNKNKALCQEPFPEGILLREARASKLYWQAVKNFLPDAYGFHKRIKKGARDPINLFLNYGYGVLFSVVYTAVCLEGFLPGLGFLHKGYKGRPALVFDMMEEFRPLVVDRLVVGLAREGRLPQKIAPKGLSLVDRKNFLLASQARLTKRLPYGNGVFMLKEIINAQVFSLKKTILTGKRYEPYICAA
ncbi:CRISPR-associated endonuclease Cas1 [Thermodesulfatator atlanticus]